MRTLYYLVSHIARLQSGSLGNTTGGRHRRRVTHDGRADGPRGRRGHKLACTHTHHTSEGTP